MHRYVLIVSLAFSLLLPGCESSRDLMREPSQIHTETDVVDDRGPIFDTIVTTGIKTNTPLFLLTEGRRDGARRIASLSSDWLACNPDSGETYLVPQGYTTDFASIPRAARWFVDQFGDHAEASILHDWLYAVGEGNETDSEKAKRQQADQAFMSFMRHDEVSSWRRAIMYLAVRIGGSDSYGSDKEWNDNWRDPASHFHEPADPPISKPVIAKVANVGNCELIRRGRNPLHKLLVMQHGIDQLYCDKVLNEAEPIFEAIDVEEVAERIERDFYIECLEKEELLEAAFLLQPTGHENADYPRCHQDDRSPICYPDTLHEDLEAYWLENEDKIPAKIENWKNRREVLWDQGILAFSRFIEKDFVSE